MIDRKVDVVEWALLVMGLEEAREHLDDLIKKMNDDDFDEVDFSYRLAHIYAHLNRAWNGRNKKGEWSNEDFDRFGQFPLKFNPDLTRPPLGD